MVIAPAAVPKVVFTLVVSLFALIDLVAIFTATEIVTMLAALGILIAGIGTVIVNIIMALRKSVEEVKVTAKTIEGHVNSAASTSTAKIDGLQKQIETLQRSLAERKQDAALLAQAAVTKAAPATPLPVSVVPQTGQEPLPVVTKETP